MPIASAIGSVVGAVGNIFGADAAAQDAGDGINAANATLTQAYQQILTQQQPYMQFGQGAINPLNALLGLNGQDPQVALGALRDLPGYQFANQEGLRAQQNSATARGLGLSGAALKEATRYSTGLADATYSNQVQRLMAALGVGQNAANVTSQAALSSNQQMANNFVAGGNMQGQSTVAKYQNLFGIPSAAAQGYAQGGIYENILNQANMGSGLSALLSGGAGGPVNLGGSSFTPSWASLAQRGV